MSDLVNFTKNFTVKSYQQGVKPPIISGENASSVWKTVTRFKSATVRNPKSASGWRQPSSYGRVEEIWTPYPLGQSRVDFLGRPVEYYSYYNYNSYNRYAGKISLMTATDSMVDSVIMKALSKLKAQKVNLSVAFGERKEAAEMMAHTVTNIAKSVRQFRGRNPLQWLKVLKNQTGHGKRDNIPNSWLELQYGWKPLMQDVHGAVSALNGRERDGDAYRATVKAALREKGTRTVQLNGPPYCMYSVPLTYEYGTAVRLDYVLENPLLATLAQLGITNPAELVWELVPYSFVIDWFTPVGNYLSSLDAALGWSLKGGSRTDWARHQGEDLAQGYTYQGYYQGTNISHKYECNQFAFNRTVYTSSPLPRFPGIKNPLSTGHIANAMSLLVSAFR